MHQDSADGVRLPSISQLLQDAIIPSFVAHGDSSSATTSSIELLSPLSVPTIVPSKFEQYSGMNLAISSSRPLATIGQSSTVGGRLPSIHHIHEASEFSCNLPASMENEDSSFLLRLPSTINARTLSQQLEPPGAATTADPHEHSQLLPVPIPTNGVSFSESSTEMARNPDVSSFHGSWSARSRDELGTTVSVPKPSTLSSHSEQQRHEGLSLHEPLEATKPLDQRDNYHMVLDQTSGLGRVPPEDSQLNSLKLTAYMTHRKWRGKVSGVRRSNLL